MSAPIIKTTSAKESLLHLANVMADVKSAPVVTPNPEPEMTMQEALELQSSVADGLLKDNGWAIAEALFDALSEGIQVTQLFVIPVALEIERVREALGEHAPAFEVRFDALREDLAKLADVALVTYKTHKGRTDEVGEQELELLTAATLAYSKIQNQIEQQVGPELESLMEILEVAGIGTDVLQQAMQKALAEQEA